MTGAMKATLILIAVVMIGMAGSFIWFVSTWDKEAEPALGFGPASVVSEQEERLA
jgi:flagellar basal body-associated protein FliL